MSDLKVYVVCDGIEDVGEGFQTLNYFKAKELAKSMGDCVVEVEYQYVGSGIVADYRDAEEEAEEG
jgi:hypothetical protein